MLTSLFPLNDTHITISQGTVGDCYLLSALDCIFTSGPEGYQKIKSLFTQTQDHVEVRIQRNNTIYKNLLARKQLNALQGKYVHNYNQFTNEDVFLISNENLKRIDNSTGGVKTNSLAVKILEHLSTYYFDLPQSSQPYQPTTGALYSAPSLLEHNRQDRFMVTSSKFVGNLLNIDTMDVQENHAITIMVFKDKIPNYPIYIGMEYGIKDQNNKYHGRHAYRLKAIVMNPNDIHRSYFELVDPHNNTSTKFFSYKDIMDRSPRFCLFHLKPQLINQINQLFITPNKNIHAAQMQQAPQTPPAPIKPVAFKKLERPVNSDDLIAAMVLINLNSETEQSIELIKNTKSTGIDVEFIKKWIEAAGINNSLHLFHQIFHIHAHNPGLARTLFQIAKNNLPSLFDPKNTFYALSLSMQGALNKKLAKWFFETLNPTKDIPGAQDIELFIIEMEAAIQNLVISYVDCTTKYSLYNKRCDYHEQLHTIIQDFKQRPGFAFPLSITELKEAYDLKRSSITTMGEDRIAAIELLSMTEINKHISQVKELPVLFDDLQSASEIDKKKDSLFNQISVIKISPALLIALNNLSEEQCKQKLNEFDRECSFKRGRIRMQADSTLIRLTKIDDSVSTNENWATFFATNNQHNSEDNAQPELMEYNN